MNDYLTTRELYHHGIKGQKWGVRKAQNDEVNNSGRIGGVVGAAIGGLGAFGLVKHFTKGRQTFFAEDTQIWMDAKTRRPLSEVQRNDRLKIAGAAFVGGMLGRTIARASTKSRIQQENADSAREDARLKQLTAESSD